MFLYACYLKNIYILSVFVTLKECILTNLNKINPITYENNTSNVVDIIDFPPLKKMNHTVKKYI